MVNSGSCRARRFTAYTARELAFSLTGNGDERSPSGARICVSEIIPKRQILLFIFLGRLIMLLLGSNGALIVSFKLLPGENSNRNDGQHPEEKTNATGEEDGITALGN